MPQSVSVQLKLRRLFRYGYFAFLAIAVALLVLLGVWIADGNVSAAVMELIPDRAAVMMIVLAVGLSVPLFFAAWLLVGTAVLGGGNEWRSLMDGVRD